MFQVSRLRLSCAASIIIWFVLPFDTNCQSKKTNVSFTDQLYLVQEFILEVRKFFKDEAFNVFKLELLNSKGLTEIHAGLVAKVCHVINARFLLP